MAEAIKKLAVLHTNDIHSFFEQMPKVKTAIDHLKSGYDPNQVLIVDCGDHMDRMRIETEGSDGLANIHIMNKTGYEAAIIGNNEGLTFMPDVLSAAYKEAEFPIISSNLHLGNGHVAKELIPYLMIKKAGLTVGIIGVTAYYADFYALLNWELLEPIPEVVRWVNKLRPQVDIVIVLSHLGLAHDQRMAEEIEGIDLIVGGHTHHLLEKPILVNDTYIGAAGKFGQHVGVIEMHYNTVAKAITYVEGRCEEVNHYPECPELLELIERYRLLGKSKLGDTVVELDAPMDIAWDHESELGNLLARGVRQWVGAEIGIVNAGQILSGLPRGKVTREKLLEICPAPINPCMMNLTGEHIWRAMEESLLESFIEKPIRGYGFRGKMLGVLCVDGLHIDFDPQRAPYEKIVQAWVNDEPLQKDRMYRVGSLDMFTFGQGLGYVTMREGEDVQYFLPEFIRDVLEKQLRDPDEIEYAKQNRWRSINHTPLD